MHFSLYLGSSARHAVGSNHDEVDWLKVTFVSTANSGLETPHTDVNL